MNNAKGLPEINNPGFFNILISREFLNEHEVQELRKKYPENAFAALFFLIKQQPSAKGRLCRLWADSIGVAYIELEKTIFQPDVVEKIPSEIAQNYKVIPIYQLGKAITVATFDPTNQGLAKQLQDAIGVPVSLVFSLPEEIDNAINKAYHFAETLKKFIDKISSSTLFQKNDLLTAEKLFEVAGNQAIVELPICIILFAVKEKATDIHIEPGREMTRIRFRIDGVLKNRMHLEISLHSRLIDRLKTLANIEGKETNKPRQGKISFPLPDQRVELYFSTIPTMSGEKATLKVIAKTRLEDVESLDRIFLSKKNYDQFRKLLRVPYGLLLVAGSYGSEKSGLIYSALKYLNTDEINITTVEDTVKYRLNGINQIHVAPSNGLDPVSAIQCCISQDTQVLATDEIRNKDEAGELLEAARTGHLVVSGINANNVFQAILRLFRMGFNSGDVLPVLLGVMATRSARKLCPQCKEKYRASKEEIETYFDTEGEFTINLYKPKGCRFCYDTGYSGRIALHELLILNNKFRKLVHSDITLMSLTESAEKENFQSMRYDGMKKVLRGLTTFDEINRVTMPQL